MYVYCLFCAAPSFHWYCRIQTYSRCTYMLIINIIQPEEHIHSIHKRRHFRRNCMLVLLRRQNMSFRRNIVIYYAKSIFAGIAYLHISNWQLYMCSIYKSGFINLTERLHWLCCNCNVTFYNSLLQGFLASIQGFLLSLAGFPREQCWVPVLYCEVTWATRQDCQFLFADFSGQQCKVTVFFAGFLASSAKLQSPLQGFWPAVQSYSLLCRVSGQQCKVTVFFAGFLASSAKLQSSLQGFWPGVQSSPCSLKMS
jgi:hypothetical protein